MPVTFQTAVALRLAALLSPRWVGAETKVSALEERAARALKDAMRNDARTASIERYDGASGIPGDWVDHAVGNGGWGYR